MVDLCTVVPIWVTFNTPQPLYSEINGFRDTAVYILYGFHTTRILRALRIHKKLLLVEDEVSRSFGDMLLTLFCMILFSKLYILLDDLSVKIVTSLFLFVTLLLQIRH